MESGGEPEAKGNAVKEEECALRFAEEALGIAGVPPALEDILDIDMDTLAYTMEKHNRDLRKDILNFFAELKQKLKDKNSAELLRIGEMHSKEMVAKQEEVWILEEQLAALQTHTKGLTATLMRCASALANANETKKIAKTALLGVQHWRKYSAAEVQLKKKACRALHWHNQTYRKNRVFYYWKEWVRSEIRNNCKEIISKKVQVARDEIENQYKEKITLIEAENSMLKSQLEDEAKARDVMEEDMKQAFMRGVCALNLEALTVMKRGVPPGKNPFPLIFPPEGQIASDDCSLSNDEPASGSMAES